MLGWQLEYNYDQDHVTVLHYFTQGLTDFPLLNTVLCYFPCRTPSLIAVEGPQASINTIEHLWMQWKLPFSYFFFFNLKNVGPCTRPYGRVRSGQFRTEPASSVPSLVKFPVFWNFFGDRTGQPCEPVRPAGFAGSGPVPITLGLFRRPCTWS